MTEDRFSSIGRLLTPRPDRRTATVHPINSEPTELAVDKSTVAEAPSPTRTSRKSRSGETPKSRESAGGNRRVVFKLDPELHSRLVEHAKRSSTSHGNIVLDAVEAAYVNDTLAQLVETSRQPTVNERTALFARTTPREGAVPSVTVEIQLRAQAVDQLDQLVTRYKADNRTQLMNAALREYLR